jgi:hypothetical protein
LPLVVTDPLTGTVLGMGIPPPQPKDRSRPASASELIRRAERIKTISV